MPGFTVVFELKSLTEPRVGGLAGSSRDFHIATVPAMGLQVCVTRPGLHGFWGLSSGHRACVLDILRGAVSTASVTSLNQEMQLTFNRVKGQEWLSTIHFGLLCVHKMAWA